MCTKCTGCNKRKKKKEHMYLKKCTANTLTEYYIYYNFSNLKKKVFFIVKQFLYHSYIYKEFCEFTYWNKNENLLIYTLSNDNWLKKKILPNWLEN